MPNEHLGATAEGIVPMFQIEFTPEAIEDVEQMRAFDRRQIIAVNTGTACPSADLHHAQ